MAKHFLVMPALLTRMAIDPKSLAIFAIASLIDSGAPRSIGATKASPPRVRISPANDSSCSTLRAATATRAPDAANASAHARPMPRLAPVTNAVRFVIRPDFPS
jgi:hypothetical protein